MGNKVSNSSFSGMLTEFEHQSGRKLLQAIRNNDPEQTQAAINFAKSECTKPVSSNVNRAEYDDMVAYLIKYLTQEYDIGDGPLFTKSPLAYCKKIYADKAADVITNNLNTLSQGGRIVKNIVSPTVGEISKDRVALAKERLKEMRKAK